MLKRGKSCKKAQIPFHLIPPKQLVSECLDLAFTLLREVITVYSAEKQIQCLVNTPKADLITMINYILEGNRFDCIIEQFVKDKDEQCSKKQFVRSWLHEIKSIRNAWAHWQTERIDYRLCSRAYDTLSLIYLGFDGNPESDLYRKIEIARKKVVVMSLKEGERKAK